MHSDEKIAKPKYSLVNLFLLLSWATDTQSISQFTEISQHQAHYFSETRAAEYMHMKIQRPFF